MSTTTISPKALPSFFKNVEIVDTDCLSSAKLLVSDTLKDQKIEAEFFADSAPVLLCSQQVKRLYQSNDFDGIKRLEKQAQKDLQPVYENIKQNKGNAWTKVRSGDEEFYLVWSDTGCMWVRYLETKQTNKQTYQMVVQVGTYTASGSVMGIQNYNISAAILIPSVVIAAIVAYALSDVIAAGISFAVATLSLYLMHAASLLGFNSLSFMIPVLQITSTATSLVFLAVFIGLVYLLDWLNRKYTIRLQIFNWDKENDWMVESAAVDNAIIAGNREDKFKRFTIKKRIEKGTPIVPPWLNPIVVLDSVCYYGVIIWENDQTFMQGCSMALKIRKGTSDQGFMWAFDCPRFSDNKHAAVNGQADPARYLKQVQWNSNPLHFSILATDSKIPVDCSVNKLSGAEENLYNIKICIAKS